MKTLIHKRKRKQDGYVALCGDKRAKNLHNWWDNVDCEKCWNSRIPRYGETCATARCENHALTFVDRKARCVTHAGKKSDGAGRAERPTRSPAKDRNPANA